MVTKYEEAVAQRLNEEDKVQKLIKLGLYAFVGILAFALFNPMVSVSAGDRAILLEFGKPVAVWSEGLHFKLPLAHSVDWMSVRTAKYEPEASAASKDLQIIHTKLALNYHLQSSEVQRIYLEIGNNQAVEDKVIAPAVQESMKAVTAKFDAAELITQRERVKNDVEELLRARLASRGINVEGISLTNFDFSPEFNRAIEEKQVAQQNAQKSLNVLEQTKTEAEIARQQAQGIADANLVRAEAEAKGIVLQANALKQSDGVLQLRYIEKWNGVLPLVQAGSSTPFILDAASLMSKGA